VRPELGISLRFAALLVGSLQGKGGEIKFRWVHKSPDLRAASNAPIYLIYDYTNVEGEPAGSATVRSGQRAIVRALLRCIQGHVIINILHYLGMNTSNHNSKPASIKTILVLDDDVLVRMPVVQFLCDCGYHVVEAASTDEAMAIFQPTFRSMWC
jgi:hypothetical protein